MSSDWSQQLADELHKPITRNFSKRSVISNGINIIKRINTFFSLCSKQRKNFFCFVRVNKFCIRYWRGRLIYLSFLFPFLVSIFNLFVIKWVSHRCCHICAVFLLKLLFTDNYKFANKFIKFSFSFTWYTISFPKTNWNTISNKFICFLRFLFVYTKTKKKWRLNYYSSSGYLVSIGIRLYLSFEFFTLYSLASFKIIVGLLGVRLSGLVNCILLTFR